MNTPRTITLDKDKLLEQVDQLKAIAARDEWQYDYDTELDELVYGKAYMPRDSFLYSVNDEINLFVSPDSTVSGVFIEYFSVNYIAHNKELEPVVPLLANPNVADAAGKAARQTREALTNELVADAFKSILSKDTLTALV